MLDYLAFYESREKLDLSTIQVLMIHVSYWLCRLSYMVVLSAPVRR